jgi:hypothetical protein
MLSYNGIEIYALQPIRTALVLIAHTHTYTARTAYTYTAIQSIIKPPVYMTVLYSPPADYKNSYRARKCSCGSHVQRDLGLPHSNLFLAEPLLTYLVSNRVLKFTL